MRPQRVLVAMSGGVDSSVAAALLRDEGHDVVGVTLRLWGGSSDQGCCSVADVDDARRVAAELDIEHLVFGFSDDFERHVVEPYVRDHALGRTPNPCIECNRHLKFDRLWRRARALGFDALATGHHARVVAGAGGWRLARGTDRGKDQSYVLWVVPPEVLSHVRMPVGAMTKAEVRGRAEALGLRTAAKPDSQDLCFVGRDAGRAGFLGDRVPLRPGRVVDQSGARVGSVAAVELVTVGQRRGLGPVGAGEPRYALDVDPVASTVTVGPRSALLAEEVPLVGVVVHPGAPGRVAAQVRSQGPAEPADVAVVDPVDGTAVLRWVQPQPRVAPGQSVVLYDGDVVVGGGIAAPVSRAAR